MARSTALPVIDISRIHAPDADRAAFLPGLRSAVHGVGYVYVHGVPAAPREQALSAAQCFFALPEERRLEIHNLNSPQFRGRTRTGTASMAGSVDRREQIDIGPERAALKTEPDDPDCLRLIGPGQQDAGRFVTGTHGQMADHVDEWFDGWFHGRAADGFIAVFPYLPGSPDVFAERFIPEPRRRSGFPTRHTGRALRDHLGLPRPSRRV